jgi:hypothetical protein
MVRSVQVLGESLFGKKTHGDDLTDRSGETGIQGGNVLWEISYFVPSGKCGEIISENRNPAAIWT